MAAATSLHAVSVTACGVLFGPWPFVNGVGHEAAIFEYHVVENDTPIEEEGWLHERERARKVDTS